MKIKCKSCKEIITNTRKLDLLNYQCACNAMSIYTTAAPRDQLDRYALIHNKMWEEVTEDEPTT